MAGQCAKNTRCEPGVCSVLGGTAVPLILLLLLLTGCTPRSYLLSPVPNRPESKIFDLKAAIVRKAVERVLVQKKYTLNPEQSNPYHLETEWLRDGRYRNRVRAQVKLLAKDQCELTVDLLLEQKAFWKESWEPLDKIEKDVYDNLMNDVLIESYRILYDDG